MTVCSVGWTRREIGWTCPSARFCTGRRTPEGQVESAEIYYDQMSMLGQLGHLELPE